MQKLNIIPFPAYFLKAKQRSKDDIILDYITQLEYNKITFKQFQSPFLLIVKHDLPLKEISVALAIYNPKYIRELNICFYECSNLDPEAIKNIGLWIKQYLQNLKKLSFCFYECNRMTYKGLMKSLKLTSSHLKGLRELNLSFICCSEFNDEDAKQIKKTLSQCIQGLGKLTLVVSAAKSKMCTRGHYYHGPNIVKRLENINSITQGDYTLKPNQMTDKGIKSLHFNFSFYLANLRTLNLMIPNIRTNSGQLKTHLTRSAKNLEKLYLGFTQTQSHDIDEIGCLIGQNMQNLQYLTLSFDRHFVGNEISQTNLFLYTLPYLPLLRGFALSITQTDKKALGYIVKHICQHTKNLESLILDIEGMNIHNQTFRKILNSLSLNLLSLKVLILNLKYTHCTTKNTTKPISSSHFQSLRILHLYMLSYQYGLLDSVTHLEELTLSLEKCTDMSNKEFEDLIVKVFSSQFSGLRKLTLAFGNPSRLTKDAMLTLCNAKWSCLSNLQTFRLIISRCNSVNSLILDLLGLCICENLANLIALEASFIECKELSTTDIKSFTQRIVGSLSKLQDLTLDFYEKVGLFVDPSLDEGTVTAVVSIISKSKINLKKLSLGLSFRFHDDRVLFSIREKLSFIPMVDLY